MTRTRRLVVASAVIGALIFLIGGTWALIAPSSFFEVVARYPPYNEHLFHDLGAFQLGLATAFVAAFGGRDGLGVALWAGAVGGLCRREITGSMPTSAADPPTRP